MVGVVAHEGGQVGSYGQAGLALLQRIVVAAIGIFGPWRIRRTAASSTGGRDTCFRG